ncbi:hypothetical protein QFC21_007167 [Naganishia friedmannii]|uniref:Uncharacterized protein n=2 Tax=Naganishia friedmannii TaxID=89922 RepID=A0ACC2UV10_9TREE|nr:hypothetical protein QFC21_007371 [Naganishia friedmannii]KAJ9091542.1 hypothetical protein QFC21_007167 [Naganishia friedmannii]
MARDATITAIPSTHTDENERRPPNTETNLSSSLTSAKSLIALQLLSRLITFSLNQALIRIASPKVFGTAAVQFDLVRDTILFLSREGVRGVVIRIPGDKKLEASSRAGRWIQDTRIHNLVNLPIILGFTVTAALLPLYLHSLPATTTSQSHFHSSLGLYVAATLLELSTEPLYLRSQLSTPVDTSIRVQAEGTAIIVRAVVTVVCLAATREQYALLAFAFGQVSYSFALGSQYVRAYWNDTGLWKVPFSRHSQKELEARPKYPGTTYLSNYFYPHHITLLGALLGQSTIKHFLTEADRIVVAWASPLEDQGGYAVASNYASLVARIVFQPVEESARLYFAREINVHPSHDTSWRHKASPFLIVFSMVRISAYLLLLCLSFVPPLAPIIFPYLLPRSYRHTSALQTLTAYLTLYLPILCMNGILEAFFAATSGVKGLGTQSGIMVASSGAFAGTLMLLSSLRNRLQTITSTSPSLHPESGVLGLFRPAWLRTWTNPEVSLVYANGISMLVRIVFAYRHATKLTDSLLGERIRRQIMKTPATRAVVVIGSFAMILRSVVNYMDPVGSNNTLGVQAGVVVLGGVLGVACLGLIYVDEKPRWKAATAGNNEEMSKSR